MANLRLTCRNKLERAARWLCLRGLFGSRRRAHEASKRDAWEQEASRARARSLEQQRKVFQDLWRNSKAGVDIIYSDGPTFKSSEYQPTPPLAIILEADDE